MTLSRVFAAVCTTLAGAAFIAIVFAFTAPDGDFPDDEDDR